MSTYSLMHTELFRIAKRADYQNIYIARTMTYTFPYALSNRFYSEDSSGVFLQNSDTRLPLDSFQL